MLVGRQHFFGTFSRINIFYVVFRFLLRQSTHHPELRRFRTLFAPFAATNSSKIQSGKEIPPPYVTVDDTEVFKLLVTHDL